MANVAAKENKEIAVSRSPKDNVRRVTRAASGTTKEGKRSHTISFTRLKPNFSRRRQRYQKHRPQKYQPIQKKRPAQLATSTCRENGRNLLVIIGILLSVPNTEQKKGANSAKSVPSYITETRTVKTRSMRRTQNQTRQQPPWQIKHCKVVMYLSENRIYT